MRFVICLVVFFMCITCLLNAQEKPDERLKNNITYYSGYVRLSDAVADISTQSGIKIYSGSSTRDWQIRDLPVVICANDIEIGKLLEMMTKAYYLTLNKELMDGKYIYRIYRPQVKIKKVQDYFDAVEAHKRQRSTHIWDVLTLLGSKNDSQTEDLYNQMIEDERVISRDIDNPRLAFNLAISYSKIINAISAKKNKGQPLVIWANDESKLSNLVKDYMYNYLSKEKDKLLKIKQDDWVLKEIQRLDNVDENSFYIDFKVDDYGVLSPNSTAHTHENQVESDQIRETVDVKAFGESLNIPIKSPPWSLSPEIDGFDLIEVSKFQNDTIKFKFIKPDKKEILLSDVISSISKATGYSIVADDYEDHRDLFPKDYSSLLGSESSLYNKLNNLNSISYLNYYFKGNQIIIKRPDWIHQYFTSLIPKAYLFELMEKTNSNGLDLMDYAIFNSLSVFQKQEWINPTQIVNGKGQWGIVKELFDVLTPVIINYKDTLLSKGILLKDLDNKTMLKLLVATNTDSNSIDFDNAYIKLVYKDYNYLHYKYTYDVILQNGQETKQFGLGIDFPIFTDSRYQFLIKEALKAKEGAK